ncbi:MAG: type III-B CRISPR module RAMP protein Cmr4 [Candidatus Calescibacterium sp.]|nr:type III-B CRISPR module RAMP protein Cmr4 [Candidatus Calescibacterium sp.]MDW8133293.1 type III-B CRISPR module RAMP protein Cmr4 [Candidatus Calescibacterium sp.]
MYTYKYMLVIYCLTPIHMGAGQSVSYIDNIVQRERITGFPTLWSSGLKGVLRAFLSKNEKCKEHVDKIFGPQDGREYASLISISDAKLLLFPVRSLKGIFAYITSPMIIIRLLQELRNLGVNTISKQNDNSKIDLAKICESLIKQKINEESVITTEKSEIVFDLNNSKKVGLEEFIFDLYSQENSKLNISDLVELIKKYLPSNQLISSDNFLMSRFAILKDDVLKDLTNYAVEIRTRIKINQSTGTVHEGALFTEEFIPSETLFYSFVFLKEDSNKTYYKQIIEELDDKVLQFGADETLGKGIAKIKLTQIS